VVALAKAQETVYFPDYRHPLSLPHSSELLRILRHARDEAHAVANLGHR
jgi:excinuclease UvrABC nuclease subunit